MAIILRKVKLVGSRGRQEVEAVFDSGSTYSCIQPQLAKRLGSPEPLPEPKKLVPCQLKHDTFSAFD